MLPWGFSWETFSPRPVKCRLEIARVVRSVFARGSQRAVSGRNFNGQTAPLIQTRDMFEYTLPVTHFSKRKETRKNAATAGKGQK